jgi:heme/copper-type cytochrome/quinol oxidase subunit 2
MNALVITFIVVGIFLILVGVAMLLVRVQIDTEGSKPIFQGPGRIMVQGPVGLVIIVIGVVCLSFSGISYRVNQNNNSPNPSPSPRPQPISLRPTARLTSPTAGTHVPGRRDSLHQE